MTRRSPVGPRSARALALLGGALLLAAACAKVPYTNRTQMMMVSQSDELALGVQAYAEILEQSKVVRDPAMTRQVRRIGEAIAAVSGEPGFEWEFNVIDDAKMVNAFALPGGKVAVYTGLFPVAVDDAGLATVMGHEVAHALARHGAERLSQQYGVQLVGTGLAVATQGQSESVRGAVMQAYGLGAQVGVMLPYSRHMESEADQIGLILMAKAGYDPAAAVGLWQRMAQLDSGGRPPEFLSTHPHSTTRINQLREWLPEAQRYYAAAKLRPKIEKLPAIR